MSAALRKFMGRTGVPADNADLEPAPGKLGLQTPPAGADSAEANAEPVICPLHVFPADQPSERLYNKGCRCSACSACHAEQARRRYHEHRNGTFRDGRRKALALDPVVLYVPPLEAELSAVQRQPVEAESELPWGVRIVMIDGRYQVVRA